MASGDGSDQVQNAGGRHTAVEDDAPGQRVRQWH